MVAVELGVGVTLKMEFPAPASFSLGTETIKLGTDQDGRTIVAGFDSKTREVIIRDWERNKEVTRLPMMTLRLDQQVSRATLEYELAKLKSNRFVPQMT